MKKKVYIVGNNANWANVSDGGRVKLRIIYNLLVKNGIETSIIDLENWYTRFLHILIEIKNAIKECATLVIMGGPNGCRVLIPIINAMNKKKRSRVIFPMLGTGVIEGILNKLTPNEIDEFMFCKNSFGKKDEFMAKELKKIDLILPENTVVEKAYRWFYGTTNIVTLTNFRDIKIIPKKYIIGDVLKIIFISRVSEKKGIFDLLECVKKLNLNKTKVLLDIFGELQLSKEEKTIFEGFIGKNITYCGVIEQERCVEKMREYDLMVLPTKFLEGTPGAIVESLISGTPVLSSSFNQVETIIKHNNNGFIFKIGDKESLYKNLEYICENKYMLEQIGKNAQKSAEKFTFDYNKENFFKLFLGENL